MKKKFFTALIFLLFSGFILSQAQQLLHSHLTKTKRILGEQQEKRHHILNKLDYPSAHSSIFTDQIKTLNAIIPDFQVNENCGGLNSASQLLPAICTDDSGNFVITWSDERNGEWDIYAQRFYRDGSTMGHNFKVNDEQGSAWQYSPPSISTDGRDNFVITWNDYRNGEWDIYAQRYTVDCSALGPNFRVNNEQGSAYQSFTSISTYDSGNFVITWVDRRHGNRDIYAQCYSSEGTVVGINFKVNDDQGSTDQSYPSISNEGSGNFVVTWHDERNGDRDIYAQRYSANCRKVGTNFKVNDDQESALQSCPSISINGSDNFVITWQDERNGNSDIYAQCYSDDGIPVGNNFIVNDAQGDTDQWNPSISTDASGNFVITWEDGRNMYKSHDIYAQLYSKDGRAVGTNFKVSDDPGSEYQRSPSICTDASGNFVITWWDGRNDFFGDIYAQLYSGDGNSIGTNFKVNDDQGYSDQGSPSISTDGIGNFIITWQDDRNGDDDIFAQRYFSDGSTVGINFKVNDDQVSAGQYRPDITTDNSGNFVITWEDWRNDDYDIYAQRHSGNGSAIGINFKVNDNQGSAQQHFPSISKDGCSNFMITWQDDRNVDDDIFAQRYSNDGRAVGTNFKVNDDMGNAYQGSPSISTDVNGNFVITWMDCRNGNSDIYAQYYSSDGSVMGTNFKVNDDQGSSRQLHHSISMDGSGNFVITWEDERNEVRDIYAQCYSSNGIAQGTNFKVNDNQGNTDHYSHPSISTDSDGNFVITWEDYRNGNWDIYAQRYLNDGSVMGSNFRVTNTSEREQFAPDVKLWNRRIYNTWTDNRVRGTGFNICANVLDWENPIDISDKEPSPKPSIFILSQNYPNPFNPGTTIQYELPQDSKVKISIFNILGKSIKVLENKMQQVGIHTVQWDGRDGQGILLSSGIYICRIEAGEFRQSIKLILTK